MVRFYIISGSVALVIFACLWLVALHLQGNAQQYIIGGIVGAFVCLPLSVMANVFASAQYEQRRRVDILQDSANRKAELEARPSDSEIVTLELNTAFYDLDGQQRGIIVREAKKAFYLPVPSDMLAAIRAKDPNFVSRPQELLGHQKLAFLEAETGIIGLETSILASIDKIALSFLHSFDEGNQPKFNNTKFGIDSIAFTRVGLHERAGALLTVYNTDYFTHSVMRDVYRGLRKRNDDYNNLAVTDIGKSRFRCLLTSLGLNAVVLLEGGTLCVLCRRSSSGLHMEAHQRWHVSMNEAFSETDRDPDSPSLKCCLSRGLREELGWEEGRVDFTASFHEFWYWKPAGEIGLSAVVNARLGTQDFREYASCAIDQNRERVPLEFKFLSYNEPDVRAFLSISIDPKHNVQITGAARHVLGTLATMGCPQP